MSSRISSLTLPGQAIGEAFSLTDAASQARLIRLIAWQLEEAS
jgi:hypothetical protein